MAPMTASASYREKGRARERCVGSRQRWSTSVSMLWRYLICCRTFFHISAYWPTLQQCRSRTYVSVIRRKWIRPKRKPSRALNCKKARRTHAQTMSFIREKRIPPPRLPPSILVVLYIYFSPYIYPSIYLSAFRSLIIFTPTRPSLLLSS